jgi:hypothetical protein
MGAAAYRGDAREGYSPLDSGRERVLRPPDEDRCDELDRAG